MWGFYVFKKIIQRMHFEVRHRTRIIKLVFLSCKHTVTHKINQLSKAYSPLEGNSGAPLYIFHLEFHIKGRKKVPCPWTLFVWRALGGYWAASAAAAACVLVAHREFFVFFYSCPARGALCPQVCPTIYIFFCERPDPWHATPLRTLRDEGKEETISYPFWLGKVCASWLLAEWRNNGKGKYVIPCLRVYLCFAHFWGELLAAARLPYHSVQSSGQTLWSG